MQHFGLKVFTLAVALGVAQADAKTFRYAYRIDPASLDPHALAETFTLSWLGASAAIPTPYCCLAVIACVRPPT
jgi:hypothetical protein